VSQALRNPGVGLEITTLQIERLGKLFNLSLDFEALESVSQNQNKPKKPLKNVAMILTNQ